MYFSIIKCLIKSIPIKIFLKAWGAGGLFPHTRRFKELLERKENQGRWLHGGFEGEMLSGSKEDTRADARPRNFGNNQVSNDGPRLVHRGLPSDEDGVF